MVQRAAPSARRKRIGDVLLEGAFITPEQLEEALEVARREGTKVGEVLVARGAVTPQILATLLSFQLNVPVVDLQQFRIDPAAVQLVPEAMAREHGILPLAIEGDELKVAMEDPSDLGVLDALAAVSGRRVRPVIAMGGGIREALNSHYKVTSRLRDEVQEILAQPAPAARAPLLSAASVAEAPVVRAVDMLIAQAVQERASDIHIEPLPEGLRIRYRIDGILSEAVSLPLGVQQALLSRIKVMAGMDIAERRRPQDGQFSLHVGDREVDFRVATIGTEHGEIVVMRVLDKSVSVLELPDVGLQGHGLQAIKNALRSPFGMLLVSGPTGSGKTTTLYSALSTLDAMTRNIITIEDPIEYRFAGVNQIQVNRQADITFASGLRSILRLDPDVILVGEIRDAETAETAVQAALTGHLVLTTIHANDSAAAVVRLIDLGVEPFLVTTAVIASVAQRLVRRVCRYCKSSAPAAPEEVVAYQAEMQEMRTAFDYGRGCNFCARTGFLGRTGVFEVLTMGDGIRRLIAQRVPSHEIKALAVQEGMVPMRRDGMIKAQDGATTPGEVIRNVFAIGS